MLQILSGLLLLTACSLGTVKTGGERPYAYQADQEYSTENLATLAPAMVTSIRRSPPVGKWDEIFSPGLMPLKRIGIVVFESILQPTRGGLSGDERVFLSAQGKQLLSEKLLSVWENALPILGPDFDYVPVKLIKRAPSFSKYGLDVEDHIKSKRDSLAPDDVFYLPRGKNTTMVTVLNPRGMRDLSLALVPAYTQMEGPKWSQNNKHFVNDIMKELKLDAVIVLLNEISWTSGYIDKHTGEHFAEEVKMQLSASTLISLSQYHDRLEKLGVKEKPSVTVCFKAYETKTKFPVELSAIGPETEYGQIQSELLEPVLKSYRDLSLMTIQSMLQDLKKNN